MQFNRKAIKAKELHLDEIKKYPEIINKVIKRNINAKFELNEKKRYWTGGGCTLYTVKTKSRILFLKIKHKSVTVESKLEEENSFIYEPCLEHEKRMIDLALKAGVSVPHVIFYDEENDFQFLATEYIEKSFEDTFNTANLEEILFLWEDLRKNVELLFNAGLVHSDIHELNLRYKDNKVILIDWEESRELAQDCIFEESLDYIGRNKVSSLGDFPLSTQQDYTVSTNCLARMRQVFRKILIPQIIEYIKECNYDSENGICTVLDHGKSQDTYQSIHNKFIDVKGQREKKDVRPILINALFSVLDINDFTFVDVGSNNGLFCREITKAGKGKIRTIGLEGFHKFNVLAKGLAFIEELKGIEYYDFLCGVDNLKDLKINNKCFVSICSVWHHIQYKEVFLDQLKNLDLRYIFLEMPVQQECYNEHSWEEEVSLIKDTLRFEDEILLGYSHDYNRPLVLLSNVKIPDSVRSRVVMRAKRVLKPSLLDKFFRLF